MPATASGLTGKPASFLDRKTITISYLLTIRNQVIVGDLPAAPKTDYVYLVVPMNIENLYPGAGMFPLEVMISISHRVF